MTYEVTAPCKKCGEGKKKEVRTPHKVTKVVRDKETAWVYMCKKCGHTETVEEAGSTPVS